MPSSWSERVRTWNVATLAIAAALYVVALVARAATWGSHAWADEAAFFATSGTLGHATDNMLLLDTNDPAASLEWLFWQRILFSLVMSPAAAMGFEAFRVWHVLISAALPVLAFALLRRHGVNRVLAAGAGLAIALHPQFVVWGTRVFPDTLMTLAFGGALLAASYRRFGVAAVLFVAACWAKEQAYFAVVVLFAFSVVSGWLQRRIRLWPPSLDYDQAQFIPALLFGLLPLGYALSIGGAFPGWNMGGSYTHLIDHLFLTIWLVPLVLLALLDARSRPLAIAGLAFPVFFILYRTTGRGAGPNYFVITAFLAMIAAAAALHVAPDVVRRFSGNRRLALVASFAAVVILVALPSGLTGQPTDVVPLAPHSEHDLPWMLRPEMERDDVLWEAVAAMKAVPHDVVFAVDIAWFWGPHPFADSVDVLRVACTCWADDGRDLSHFVRTIDSLSNVTILQKEGGPANLSLQEAYADCATFSNHRFLVFEATKCEGRGIVA